jgi:FlaG/FlaF family flagellin (archaellin)
MNGFSDDDRAFSPLAGAGVLVGVVVVLLAVIGAAVFGLIDGVAQPTAEFEVEREDGDLVVTALGPDPVPTEELSIRGEDPDGEVAFGTWPGEAGVVRPGDRVVVANATGNEKIEVVWEPVGFTRTETLASYENEDDSTTRGWTDGEDTESDPLG